jgi:predicted ATP-binding protein involved in virulence
MTFEPSRGIVVKSLDGTFLDVNKLSSGEQNEIILLYNMIFEVGDNSLLLIDEPEISLHVAWQNHFIDNLETIAENKKIQIIVATHSPQIIGDRWESCFDLCEQSV